MCYNNRVQVYICTWQVVLQRGEVPVGKEVGSGGGVLRKGSVIASVVSRFVDTWCADQ